MSKTNATPSPLLSALSLAALPHLGAASLPFARSVEAQVVLGGTVEDACEDVLAAWETPRVGGHDLPAGLDVDALIAALVEAAEPFVQREDVADDDGDDDELWQDRILEQQELEDFEGAA